ncbi:MAG: hypothetical protein ABL868_11745, partial [Sulfuriferula sp.]
MKKTIISVLLATVSVASAYAFDLNDLSNVLKQLPSNNPQQTAPADASKPGKIDPAAILMGALKRDSVDDEIQIG